jgi:hypothetical protein
VGLAGGSTARTPNLHRHMSALLTSCFDHAAPRLLREPENPTERSLDLSLGQAGAILLRHR